MLNAFHFPGEEEMLGLKPGETMALAGVNGDRLPDGPGGKENPAGHG